MGNPWTDPEFAKAWIRRIGEGGPQRAEAIGVLCLLARAAEPRRILELGVGSGLIAERLLRDHPDATLVGVDGSEAMLESAAALLQRFDQRFRLVESNFEADWPGVTGEGYDLVVSAQSIHHVEGEAKRGVFSKVFSVLAPGGLFLNADRLAVEEELFPLHRSLWNRSRARADFAPLSDAFTYPRYLKALSESEDVPDRLGVQLQWLEQVGFDPVTCLWQIGDRAVFGGRRPER